MRLLISILIVILFATMVLYVVGNKTRGFFPNTEGGDLTLAGETATLPSVFEIQEELNRRGYNLKVDGKLGPLTRAAWNKEICNQYASKEFEILKGGEKYGNH